jgi:ABC-type polysaccharide/polyol phosphate transport system ATPase subunit
MAFVSLDCVSLDFPIYGVAGRSLKKEFIHFVGGMLDKQDRRVFTVKALDNITLNIKRGTRLGIIGNNGAGKSTLLRVLSGVYTPTSGKAMVRGKVTALLDVMLGMDDESTGYENILLRGILQGLSRKEIKKKETKIVEFTELGDYLFMPIRTYSCGMKIRLAFAIATCIESEILLLDEIVGVGDAMFIEKARARLGGMIQSSDIVVLASHDLSIIEKTCTQILWLDKGKIQFYGNAEEGLAQYKNRI